MKRIGNILLLVTGILAIIGTVGYIAVSTLFYVFASPSFTDTIKSGIESGTIKVQGYTSGDATEYAKTTQLVLLIAAIIFTIQVLFSIGCALIAFLARKKESAGLYITNIVIGVLNGSIFSIVGGILGILGREER